MIQSEKMQEYCVSVDLQMNHRFHSSPAVYTSAFLGCCCTINTTFLYRGNPLSFISVPAGRPLWQGRSPCHCEWLHVYLRGHRFRWRMCWRWGSSHFILDVTWWNLQTTCSENSEKYSVIDWELEASYPGILPTWHRINGGTPAICHTHTCTGVMSN